MSARHPFVALLAIVVCAVGSAPHVHAQRTDSTSRSLACARSGTTLRLWTGSPDSALRSVPRADRTRATLDTVITLDITDRSWTRDSVAAGVALGSGGTVGVRRAPWHACVGASVLLGRVTASLHNIHGQIRFRADPGALRSIGLSSDSTPPTAPPRR